jgi:hypothetical protein
MLALIRAERRSLAVRPLSRFAPSAGFVAFRQIFVCGCYQQAGSTRRGGLPGSLVALPRVVASPRPHRTPLPAVAENISSRRSIGSFSKSNQQKLDDAKVNSHDRSSDERALLTPNWRQPGPTTPCPGWPLVVCARPQRIAARWPAATECFLEHLFRRRATSDPRDLFGDIG